MTSSPSPMQPHHAGAALRVIQGFFPGGTPRIGQASPAPRRLSERLRSGPDQARSVHGAFRSARRSVQPPGAFRPTKQSAPAPAGSRRLRSSGKHLSRSLPQRRDSDRRAAWARAPRSPCPQIRAQGPGQRPALARPIQNKMESFFNASFADVRVHVGNEAPSIGALAFTHGTDLYFAPGQYNRSRPRVSNFSATND